MAHHSKKRKKKRQKKHILPGQIFRYKFFLVHTRSLLVMCEGCSITTLFNTPFVSEILFILFYEYRCRCFDCVCIYGPHAFRALRAQKRFQILRNWSYSWERLCGYRNSARVLGKSHQCSRQSSCISSTVPTSLSFSPGAFIISQ